MVIINWVYIHSADKHALQKVNKNSYIRTITKVEACLRLEELCSRESVNLVVIPWEIKPRDVFIEFYKLIFKLPIEFLGLLEKHTYLIFPPLKCRLFAIKEFTPEHLNWMNDTNRTIQKGRRRYSHNE